jgi:hypothetical protein
MLAVVGEDEGLGVSRSREQRDIADRPALGAVRWRAADDGDHADLARVGVIARRSHRVELEGFRGATGDPLEKGARADIAPPGQRNPSHELDRRSRMGRAPCHRPATSGVNAGRL